jgi:hypothetical protein
VRQMLTVWPPLPIIIKQRGRPTSWWGVDNIVAALEHNDRIREIDLWRVPSSLLEKVLAEQFPALTFLDLQCEDDTTSAIVPGWISAKRAKSLAEKHPSPISWIKETAVVCYSPRQSIPHQNSSFRIHFIRGDGQASHRLEHTDVGL